MWIELGTMILSPLLTLVGVGLPQLNVDAIEAAPVMSCAAQNADTCLESDECDMFIGATGQEFCGVACEARSLDTCTQDTNCVVVDGSCDYADYSPVGC